MPESAENSILCGKPLLILFGPERGGSDMIETVTISNADATNLLHVYHGGSSWNIDWTDEEGHVLQIIKLYPDATWEDADV